VGSCCCKEGLDVWEAWLAVGAGLGVLVSAVSRKLDELPLSEPLVGLLVGVLLGPHVAAVLELPAGAQDQILLVAAELTLAIALMAIALRYPIDEVRDRAPEVAWLVLLAMPAMALLGAALSWAALGVSLGVALAIGAALSPTDPVLASSVVTGEPASQTLPLGLRQNLSLESGVNDGLALPLVVVAAAAVTGASMAGTVAGALWEVVGAVAVAWLLGRAAARVLAVAVRHRDIDLSHELLYSLVLALAALGVASLVGVGGLLTVFVTGLVFNAHTSDEERRQEETIDEGVNRILILPLFVLLGVALPWQGWVELGWRGPALAAGVLVLRRLPAVLALRPLIGARTWLDAAWLGWFGPVGVTAVFYLLHLRELGVTDPVVWQAGSLVVTASIVAHGITASPGRALYGRLARPPTPQA
jgi:sodium/hydrogen antiporter